MGSMQRNVNLNQKTVDRLGSSTNFFMNQMAHTENPSGDYFKKFAGGKKNKKNKKRGK